MATPETRHLKISVQGIVQGVGFRPFVYNLAKKLALTGSVANTGQGVEIFISGPCRKTDRFLDLLKTEPPPLARISDIQVSDATQSPQADDFTIVPSADGSTKTTLISPDIATCTDCINDIFSSGNRRYHYPFTNCTNCGPRMTIIRHIPYDRTNTSMACFPMCPSCDGEYHDPTDRRFHAQPNACPRCGPVLSWHDRQGNRLCQDNKESLIHCASALAEGHIVVIKGLGGFHLAVDAASDESVRKLREKKNRYGKPLAVMAADLEKAGQVVFLGEEERELLSSQERPIVLAVKKENTLSPELAPGIRELGVMLPYTPLHHLLFTTPGCPQVLVMTSANLSDEPICTGNREALARLSGIADFFLFHNRDIVTRVDDSVARVVLGRKRMIRRSRGYVPVPLAIEGAERAILGCGAEQKNTFCLSRNGQAFVSQHIGDLKGPENMVFFEESIEYFRQVLEICPTEVACDLHGDYLSSRYAATLGLPLQRIQHHHAHAAAIMAEHDLDRGLAVIYDGAGLGDDATVWGGEILHVQGCRYERLAHLAHLALPGGDRATREIWRMGLSLLAGAGLDITRDSTLPGSLAAIPTGIRRTVATMMQKKINTPATSSVGRLFDAVASLLGIRQDVAFEGQAAMELETLAWSGWETTGPETASGRYSATITKKNNRLMLDYRPLVHWILEDLGREVPGPAIALSFHLWLVRSTLALLDHLSSRCSTSTILLGGGCFQNVLLLEMMTTGLEENGFRVFSGEQIPVNDGGIALGQVFITAITPSTITL
ncbi:carbamoyltransferase HypF [Desulfolithobacter dissulfuricans]|uniref:Carbamoyltransferase n=1 Tax=Desulfolithobacter dissulfuricans TaxID=2795293 RepID=A0A915U264_9BACT|nr:carbamoyltransferase HypF [Desulfolithobacter dissulfuricans]BCO09450.1 carbamoyltransferase HypF [Desulfolithobacter dissulfuricans]